MSALAPFFERCPVCGATSTAPLVSFEELQFVRCAGCGLLYKSHEEPGLVGRLAKAYDAEYFTKGRAQYLKRWAHRVAKCERQLLACLEFAPQARRALDVGCSAGYVMAAAARLGLHGVGIDVAAFTTALSKERGFDTATALLEALPFRDGSFDVVTAKHTLEHVREPARAISEVRRVLRAGGVAFIVVPDADYWRVTRGVERSKYFHPRRLGTQHHVYYSIDNLSRLLRDAGLEVVSTDKAMFRRRLAKGPAAAWEGLRYAGLKAWTTTSRVTHLRREIQVIARKPA